MLLMRYVKSYDTARLKPKGAAPQLEFTNSKKHMMCYYIFPNGLCFWVRLITLIESEWPSRIIGEKRI